MRVLHVSSGNLYGGIETMLVTMARHRAECPSLEQEFAVSFEGRLAEELRETGAAVHSLGAVRLSRPASVWRARRELAKIVALRQHVHAVICHGAWPLVAFGGAARAAGIPLVVWLHGPPDGRNWLDRVAALVPPDFVIANSAFTASHAARWLPRVSSTVIHCAVGDLGVPARARADVRRELDAPEHAIVLMQTCRMEAWKGQRTLLAALARLGESPEWRCWIVGGAQRDAEQEYVRELQALAQSLGVARRVAFCGDRRDVTSLLGAADIYCQPNTSPEPFGISIIEAMHQALPVVASSAGGALEIVDETCGVLVTAGDVAALAAAIDALARDGASRARLGEGGRRRAKMLCEPRDRLRDLEHAIRGLVEFRAASPSVRMPTGAELGR
jgi:glycosyltransferase involved in cell wall biosynthesis